MNGGLKQKCCTMQEASWDWWQLPIVCDDVGPNQNCLQTNAFLQYFTAWGTERWANRTNKKGIWFPLSPNWTGWLIMISSRSFNRCKTVSQTVLSMMSCRNVRGVGRANACFTDNIEWSISRCREVLLRRNKWRVKSSVHQQTIVVNLVAHQYYNESVSRVRCAQVAQLTSTVDSMMPWISILEPGEMQQIGRHSGWAMTMQWKNSAVEKTLTSTISICRPRSPTVFSCPEGGSGPVNG